MNLETFCNVLIKSRSLRIAHNKAIFKANKKHSRSGEDLANALIGFYESDVEEVKLQSGPFKMIINYIDDVGVYWISIYWPQRMQPDVESSIVDVLQHDKEKAYCVVLQAKYKEEAFEELVDALQTTA